MNLKPWLKMWVRWLNDPEMVGLTLAEAGAWWKLYTLAHSCGQEGRVVTDHGRPLTLDEMRNNLRLKASDYTTFDTMIEKMVKEGSLHWGGDTLIVTHYLDDQMTAPSDTKEARAERQRKRRDRLFKEYGSKDNPVPLPVRLVVIERDKCLCQHCGKQGARTTPTSSVVINPTDNSPFEFDHIIPRARGGTDDPENIVLSCRACNRSRNARPVSQESRDNAPPRTPVVENNNKREGVVEKTTEGERSRDRSLQTCYKPPSNDPIIAEVSRLYEENIGELPHGGVVIEDMTDFAQHFKGDVKWIKLAFKEALGRNKRQWQYIRAILERWQEEGGPDGRAGQELERSQRPQEAVGRPRPSTDRTDPLEATRKRGWKVKRSGPDETGSDEDQR